MSGSSPSSLQKSRRQLTPIGMISHRDMPFSSKRRKRIWSSQKISSGMRIRLMKRSEEHTSELQSRGHLVCRLLLEKKNLYLTLPTFYLRERRTFEESLQL